jgi:predicted permease
MPAEGFEPRSMANRVIADMRFAFRGLRRSPGFAILTIGILALGIGANTAAFSVINGVLIRPLPYPGADRIVTLSERNATTSETSELVVVADVMDWRDQSTSFDAMAVYGGGDSAVSTGSAAEYARVTMVSPDFFRVFGISPRLGRFFTADAVSSGTQTVVISYAYWQDHFGGDAGVLQRTVRIGSGAAAPIVGVLPDGFGYPRGTDLWVADTAAATSRTRHNRLAIGRLKANVPLSRAQSDLTTVAARLEQEYPNTHKGRGVVVRGLQDELVNGVRMTLYLLWGVVLIVLLIACANTATLLLGKASARSREIAIRIAIGATRTRIISQLITESMMLALLAGTAGIVLAYWGVTALVALVPFEVVRDARIRLDGSVLAFTLAVSVVTSLFFGLAPALHALKVQLTEALKVGGGGLVIGGRRINVQGVLVVAEVALSVVLLTGAGLLAKSVVALQNVPLGFEPENVLGMKATGVRSIRENNAFFTDVMARLRSLPEVTAVGAMSAVPGDLSNSGSGAIYADRMPETRDRATEPEGLFTIVAPGTFATLGIPVKAGRDFDDGDIVNRPLVAIVNETLVKTLFNGENPIGRTIFCNFDRNDPMTVVGVVGDVRQSTPAAAPVSECYMPYRQHAYNNGTLYVVARTVGEPLTHAATIRRAAAEVSPDVPVSFTTIEAALAKRVEAPRFRAVLLALFAGLAVCLAMGGVYGVMAYAAEQRSKEIALRMALGARRASVVTLIMREGLILATVGLAFGFVGALMTTRLLTNMLFEVQPLDIYVYAAAAALLILVTLVAGFVPGRRAAIVDPAVVLKAA